MTTTVQELKELFLNMPGDVFTLTDEVLGIDGVKQLFDDYLAEKTLTIHNAKADRDALTVGGTSDLPDLGTRNVTARFSTDDLGANVTGILIRVEMISWEINTSFLTFSAEYLQEFGFKTLYLVLSAEPGEDGNVAPAKGVGADFPFQAKDGPKTLSLVALLPEDPEADYALTADFAGISLSDLSALTQFTSQGNFNIIPADIPLASELQLVKLRVVVDPMAHTVVVAAVEVRLADSWSIIPEKFEFEAIHALFSVTYPTSSPRVFASLSATLKLLDDPSLIAGITVPDLDMNVMVLQPVQLGSLLQKYLPNAGLQDLQNSQLTSLSFYLNARTRVYKVQCDIADAWHIADKIALSDLYMMISGQGTGIPSGAIKATFDIAGTSILLGASYVDSRTGWQFTGELLPGSSVNLSSLITRLLPDDATLPDELPDIVFSDINVSATPASGEFLLRGKSIAIWDLPFGVPGLSANVVDLTIHIEHGSIDCSLTLHSTGPVTIVEELIFQNMQLTFDLNQAEHTWAISGSVSAMVLDTDFTLAASLNMTRVARTLKLEAQSGAGLSVPIGAGSLTGNDLTIMISKALAQTSSTEGGSGEQASASAEGVKLDKSSLYTWSVSAAGHASVPDIFESSGTLELWDTGKSIGLAFKPTTATAPIPLKPLSHLTAELELEHLSIVVTKNDQGKKSWSFDTAIGIWFSGVPERLQLTNILPSSQDRRVEGHFKVDNQGALIEVDNLVSIADLNLPEIDTGVRKLDLGKTGVEVSSFQLQLGKDIMLSTDFGFGIPRQLNAIFGTKTDGSPMFEFFNTYDPQAQSSTQTSGQSGTLAATVASQDGSPSTSLKDNPTISRFKLSLDRKGLQVQMLTSPIKAITLTTVTDAAGKKQTTCNADLGEFGAITFTLPAFSYNGNSFTGSGSFTQTRELKLPLVPFKLLLQACKLGTIADKIPDGLPVREIQVYDAQTGKFNGEALIKMLNDLGQELGQAKDSSIFALGSVIEEAIRELDNYLDRLPDSFKNYLDISIPKEFSFNISVSEEGTFQGSVSTDPATPIKVLYPAMGLLGPQLNGITLRNFSVGEMFGGAVLPVNVDMDVHQFNLSMLLPALVLPEDPVPLLPRTQDLVTHIPVHKLFMIVIYEAGIPILVPIFFDQLGLEYLGLEGVNFQVHGSFPNPISNLGASDALTLFSAFKQFFTDPHYQLDGSTLPQVVLTIGPNMLQLPQYLGGKTLIEATSSQYNKAINITAELAQALNTLKQHLLQSFNLNGIVQAIPLSSRIGQQQVTLGSVNVAQADWLITTAQEFHTLSAEQLSLANLSTSDIGPMLGILPAAQIQASITDLTTQIAVRKSQLEGQNAQTQQRIAALNAEIKSRQIQLETQSVVAQKQITDLTSQIAARKSQLAAKSVQAQAQVTALQAQVINIQAQIQTVSTQINQVTSNIAAMHQQALPNPSALIQQEAQLAQLQAVLANLKMQLSTVNAALQAAQQSINTAQTDPTLTSLNAELQAAQQSLVAASGDTDPVLTSLRLSLQAAQQSLVNTATDSSLVKLNTLLAATPTSLEPTQGQVVFFKGGWQVANEASLTTYFGLVGTAQGFSTGMGISGSLAGLLDLNMSGLVAINSRPQPGEPVFSLSGKSALSILDEQVFSGSLALTNNRFDIDGVLHLFPRLPNLLAAHVSGHLSDTELSLTGDVAIILGNTFTLAGGSISITHTGLTITGTWLNQTITFSAQKVNNILLLQATLSQIKIDNVLQITGLGTNAGPSARFGLDPTNVPFLSLDGMISLPLISTQGQGTFQIGEQGFNFSIGGQIFGTFSASLMVKGSDMSNAGTFTITASMQSDLFEYLQQQVSAAINDAVQTLNRTLASLQQAAADAQQRINQANREITSAQAQINQKFGSAQQTVFQDQQEVNSLQMQIDATQQQLNNTPWYRFDEQTALGSQLGGLYLAKKTADGTLAAAQAFLQGILQGTDDSMRALQTELTNAQRALANAQIDLNKANTSLTQVEQANSGTLAASQYISQHTLTSLLVVNAATFTGQYSVISGGTVSLVINLTYMGRNYPNETITFDFHNPLDSAKGLVTKLQSQVSK